VPLDVTNTFIDELLRRAASAWANGNHEAAIAWCRYAWHYDNKLVDR
jgi:hypothetical protein